MRGFGVITSKGLGVGPQWSPGVESGGLRANPAKSEVLEVGSQRGPEEQPLIRGPGPPGGEAPEAKCFSLHKYLIFARYEVFMQN